MPTELFGLTLDGDIDPTTIATAAVVVLELIDNDGHPYLRLISSDLPVWRRLGMLACVVASDEADAVHAFQPDDPEKE